MNFITANTTNQRRVIMFVATLVFGVFTALVFYKIPLTFRNLVFPPVVGLFVFELLFRTKNRLSLKTLPLYVLIVLLASQIIYGILYSLSSGYLWSPINTLQFLFSEFLYNLYALIDSSVVTCTAYYLVKKYRFESWVIQENNPQVIYGFLGWYVVNILIWLLGGAEVGGHLSWWGIANNLLILPVNVIVLIVLAWRKSTRDFAKGILAAFAVNFLISLAIGQMANAICFVPFVFPQ